MERYKSWRNGTAQALEFVMCQWGMPPCHSHDYNIWPCIYEEFLIPDLSAGEFLWTMCCQERDRYKCGV